MRTGDRVLYVGTPGKPEPATVMRVLGSGPSGFKILDLQTAAGKTAQAVPHVSEYPLDSGYWVLTESDVKPAPAPTYTPRRRRRMSEEPPVTAEQVDEQEDE